MSELTFPIYTDDHAEAFKLLNEEWISKYFVMEESDRQALHHPKEKILEPGGDIIIASYEGEVIGTCALIKMDGNPYDFELAKMAISPKVQGKGFGYALGMKTLGRAKELGAKSVYLESNRILTPAISLYKKLGFVEVKGLATPYDRCDIKMAVDL